MYGILQGTDGNNIFHMPDMGSYRFGLVTVKSSLPAKNEIKIQFLVSTCSVTGQEDGQTLRWWADTKKMDRHSPNDLNADFRCQCHPGIPVILIKSVLNWHHWSQKKSIIILFYSMFHSIQEKDVCICACVCVYAFLCLCQVAETQSITFYLPGYWLIKSKYTSASWSPVTWNDRRHLATLPSVYTVIRIDCNALFTQHTTI